MADRNGLVEKPTAHADQCPDCGNLYTGHGLDAPPYCGHEFECYLPVEVAVVERERPKGIHHKDGPLAQVEQMARWADGIAANPWSGSVAETSRKIASNLRSAVDALARERPPLADVLHEVANSGVSFEDPRVGYVEVQIDRVTWTELRALASSTTEEQPYRPPWADIPATVPKDGRDHG